MSIVEEIADRLAQEAIAAAGELDDEQLIAEVSKVIGAASTTTQEAFMTAVRVRLSEQRARKYLAARLAKGPRNPGGPKVELGSRPILDPAGDGH